MLELRDIMRPVCNIRSEVSSTWRTSIEHNGIGVFVAPDKVLTAWHVLRDAKSVIFANSDGETAKLKMQRGGGYKSMKAFDLAVAVLDRPIGRETCLVPNPDSRAVAQFDRGFMLTRFHGAASHFRVTVDAARNMQEQSRIKPRMNTSYKFIHFTAPVDVKRGYSGSPVLNADGFVMSVVTGVEAANSEAVAAGTEKARLREKSFVGPGVRETAAFLRNAL